MNGRISGKPYIGLLSHRNRHLVSRPATATIQLMWAQRPWCQIRATGKQTISFLKEAEKVRLKIISYSSGPKFSGYQHSHILLHQYCDGHGDQDHDNPRGHGGHAQLSIPHGHHSPAHDISLEIYTSVLDTQHPLADTVFQQPCEVQLDPHHEMPLHLQHGQTQDPPGNNLQHDNLCLASRVKIFSETNTGHDWHKFSKTGTKFSGVIALSGHVQLHAYRVDNIQCVVQLQHGAQHCQDCNLQS